MEQLSRGRGGGCSPGADPGFQVGGGGYLKKLRRAEGAERIVGVFRVKNHDFTPKNHIFSNCRGGGVHPLDPPLQSAMHCFIHTLDISDRCIVPFILSCRF